MSETVDPLLQVVAGELNFFDLHPYAQNFSNSLQDESGAWDKRRHQMEPFSAAPSTFAVPNQVQIEHYEQREHVLIAPEMYIGSTAPIQRKEYSYDPISNSIALTEVTLAPAIVHLFMEALANSVDNITRSRKAGVDCGSIVVTMDETTVSIYNEGVPLPITYDDKAKTWKPTMAFGLMNTSSNFTGDRSVIGRNGVGIKANNIWSRHFTAEVVDASRSLSFAQTWEDNMSRSTEPAVAPFQHHCSCVRITYQLDFQRLGIESYPVEAFGLFMYCCINASFTCRVPVYFNQQCFNYTEIEKYAALYFRSQKPIKSLVHRTFPGESGTNSRKKGVQNHDNQVPTVEILALDTPHSAITISFVNGMLTPDGGVHVDNAIRAVTLGIIKAINGNTPQQNPKKTKDPNTQAKPGTQSKSKDGAPKLTIRDVRNHISIFVSVQVTNPVWHSQMKTALKGPSIPIELDPHLLKQVEHWDLVETLKATLRDKKAQLLAKTDGSKRRFLGEIKGMDANEAGGARSSECTLIIIEGNSASNYAVVMTSQIPNGRDWIGMLPIRGKLRNAIKADDEQMANNVEVREIKKMFGLQDGMDYSIPELRNTLRYGRMMLMMDSDVDGHHIEALLLAFIDKYFPQLITIGMVVEYRTPYLRLKKGNVKLKFYFEHDYEEWKRQNDSTGWEEKYYKGLGSSSEADVIEDFNDPKVVTFVRDPLASESLQLAFNSKRTDDRKRWIHNYTTPPALLSVPNTITVSDYINHVLITYSRASIRRHLPLLEDGLIPSRRKVLWATFKKWGYRPVKPAGYKIGLLAASTIEKTRYHHGDSLPNVIVAMAQDFTGANNLHYFTQESMLGTREFGGKDAAKPRYTDTKPNWWLPYVFHPEDADLLARLEDEGKKIEPAFFIPILPMHLINGANQTATAYSTFIPNHHPLHVLEWLLLRLKNNSTIQQPKLMPWYRNFIGEIEIIDRKKVKKDLPPDEVPAGLPNDNALEISDEDEEVEQQQRNTEWPPQIPLEDEVHNSEVETTQISTTSPGERAQLDHQLITYRERSHHWSMVTRGKYHVRPDGTVVVTELPIGLWTASYRNWLIRMQLAKRITGYSDLSTHHRVCFEIRGLTIREKKKKVNPLALDEETVKMLNSAFGEQYTANVPQIEQENQVDVQQGQTPENTTQSGTVVAPITPNKHKDKLHKQLRLIKSYGLNDMILIDNQCQPRRYDSVEEIMETFYRWRLPLYELRRQYLIHVEKQKVLHQQGKMNFLVAVLERRIALTRQDGKPRKTAEIHADIDNLGLQRIHFSKTVMENVTHEQVELLQQEIAKLSIRLQQLENSTASSIWEQDLLSFKQQYEKHYPNDQEISECVVVPGSTSSSRGNKGRKVRKSQQKKK